MSSPPVARQMDPPDSKQPAESHKLPHLLPWIHSITQMTLSSSPNMTGWPPVSKQLLALILNQLWGVTMQNLALVTFELFFYVISETVTYIDFNQKANLQCFGLTYFIFHILLQLAVNILVNPGSSPVYELELKSGHCLHSQQCNF